MNGTLVAARAAAALGLVDECVEALEHVLDEMDRREISIGIDDRDNVLLTTPYDAPLIEALRRVRGVTRHMEEAHWCIPPRSLERLVVFFEGLARPVCSNAGCSLGGDRPPSTSHLDAHRRACEQGRIELPFAL